MKSNDESTLISVIKLYYEQGLSQEEIASKQFISKSTVSRIINKAVSKGYVKTTLCYPMASHREMEDRLCNEFSIESATVVPTYVDDYELRLRDASKALIHDLRRFTQNDDIITVSWGRTLEYIAHMIDDEQPMPKKRVTVVQSNGGVAGDLSSVHTTKIVEGFRKLFLAKGYLLPVPLLLDNSETAAALLNDSRLKPIMDMIRRARIAVFSIGQFSDKSVHFERGTMSRLDYEQLSSLKPVGDICAHYFDLDGNIVSPDLSKRTLGISLEELKQKPHRMAIAIGKNKVKAMMGALRTGAINRLYTDELTAKEMIESSEI